ncbi:MAG: hypothetical protein GY754_05720 [bacterium]|nr:hypothetical protein [bacterium]
MNTDIPLYSWIRSGTSIYRGQITGFETAPASSRKEEVLLDIKIEDVLFEKEPGKQKDKIQYKFLRPADEYARLKFPDPLWGRVMIEKGNFVFLVNPGEFNEESDPLYISDIKGLKDPFSESIRIVLDTEKKNLKPDRRMNVYLEWIEGDNTIQKLFAAEALAKDSDFANIDDIDKIAVKFSGSFMAEKDTYTGISIGTWMWNNIYSRAGEKGKINIINATINRIGDRDEDIKQFSLDQIISNVKPEIIQNPGVIKNDKAIGYLKERLELEEAIEVREQVQAIIDAMQI